VEYFTEVGRHIYVGKIPKELKETFNLAKGDTKRDYEYVKAQDKHKRVL